MASVELGVLGWVGVDEVIRPALQDIGADQLPLGKTSRRLNVHRQAGKTGDSKTDLAGARLGDCKAGAGTELAGMPFRMVQFKVSAT